MDVYGKASSVSVGQTVGEEKKLPVSLPPQEQTELKESARLQLVVSELIVLPTNKRRPEKGEHRESAARPGDKTQRMRCQIQLLAALADGEHQKEKAERTEAESKEKDKPKVELLTRMTSAEFSFFTLEDYSGEREKVDQPGAGPLSIPQFQTLQAELKEDFKVLPSKNLHLVMGTIPVKDREQKSVSNQAMYIQLQHGREPIIQAIAKSFSDRSDIGYVGYSDAGAMSTAEEREKITAVLKGGIQAPLPRVAEETKTKVKVVTLEHAADRRKGMSILMAIDFLSPPPPGSLVVTLTPLGIKQFLDNLSTELRAYKLTGELASQRDALLAFIERNQHASDLTTIQAELRGRLVILTAALARELVDSSTTPDFNFGNVVRFKSESGTEGVAVVDICKEHPLGVGKLKLTHELDESKATPHYVLHTVTAHSTDLVPAHVASETVVHVDPAADRLSVVRTGLDQPLMSTEKFDKETKKQIRFRLTQDEANRILAEVKARNQTGISLEGVRVEVLGDEIQIINPPFGPEVTLTKREVYPVPLMTPAFAEFYKCKVAALLEELKQSGRPSTETVSAAEFEAIGRVLQKFLDEISVLNLSDPANEEKILKAVVNVFRAFTDVTILENSEDFLTMRNLFMQVLVPHCLKLGSDIVRLVLDYAKEEIEKNDGKEKDKEKDKVNELAASQLPSVLAHVPALMQTQPSAAAALQSTAHASVALAAANPPVARRAPRARSHERGRCERKMGQMRYERKAQTQGCPGPIVVEERDPERARRIDALVRGGLTVVQALRQDEHDHPPAPQAPLRVEGHPAPRSTSPTRRG